MATASKPADNEPLPSLYDAFILDHIKNARNYRLPERPARALTGLNALCGDELTLYLVAEDERIEEVAFQCSCCGICMASASIMTQVVIGRTSGDTAALLRAFLDAFDHPGSEGTASFSPEQQALLEAARKYPSRGRCALLPWATLRTAFE